MINFENEVFESIEKKKSFTAGSNVAKMEKVLEITPAKLKSQMYNIISKYTGLYSDDSWQAITKMMGELTKLLPNLTVIGSEYKHDEKGQPNRKIWNYAGVVKDKKGKYQIVVVDTTAHGAGSIKDPLDKYDITCLVNILSPNSIKDLDLRDYIDSLNLK